MCGPGLGLSLLSRTRCTPLHSSAQCDSVKVGRGGHSAEWGLGHPWDQTPGPSNDPHTASSGVCQPHSLSHASCKLFYCRDILTLSVQCLSSPPLSAVIPVFWKPLSVCLTPLSPSHFVTTSVRKSRLTAEETRGPGSRYDCESRGVTIKPLA